MKKRCYKKDKDHRINSTVNKEMYTKLLELSQQLSIPMSALIRQFIAQGLNSYYDTSKLFK